MKFSTTIILAAALGGGIAIAGDMNSSAGRMGNMEGMAGMMGMMHNMQAMDANGDQMVSREEFLKTHEAMFDSMKKNKEGSVAVKDLPCM